jgi:bacteriocin-like protein
MTNKEKIAEKPDAAKTKETTREQENLTADELAKISGGAVYKPPMQKGIN